MKHAMMAMALALVAAPVFGDVVHLKNGGTLEGQVTLTEDSAIIRLPVGEVRVSSDAIERIEKKETPFDQYLKRAAAIREDDPEAHYQLGLWAQGAGLKHQAADEFGKALALKPDHEGAHQALGHRKVNGQWLTPEDEMRAKGLVERDGQWVTPEVATKLDTLKAELALAREKRLQAEAQLQRAQQVQPAYTYDGYYSSRSYVSSYPYYSTVPYTYVTPYSVYGYAGAWPSFYYSSSWCYPRSYGYRASCWPSSGLWLGWSSCRGSWSGHHGGGHRR